VTRVLLIGALLAVVFWVFSIVDCVAQPSIRHRGVNKPIWVLIVVFIPVLGGFLWFAVGRVRAVQLAIPDSPADDPAFMDTVHPLSAQDERIRQLEEELAKLDAEEDLPQSPGGGTPRTESSRTDTSRTDSSRNETPRSLPAPLRSPPVPPRRMPRRRCWTPSSAAACATSS